MLVCLFVLGPQQTDDLSLLLAPWQLGLAPALNMQKKMIDGVFCNINTIQNFKSVSYVFAHFKYLYGSL